MKKRNKIISIVLLSLLVIGLASAALVTYLSNTVSGTVDVNSPLELIGDNFTVNSEEAFNPITRDFTLVNKVNTEIKAIVEIEVAGNTPESNFNNLTIGEEFKVFKIGMKMSESDCTASGGIEWNISTESYCYWNASVDKAYSGVIDGKYYVQMGDREHPTPIPANATLNGRLKVQFKTDITPALYTFTIQVVTSDGARNLA